MLFIHVIDNGATLIIQNLMPRHLQWWITFGASFAHYWIALPIMGILASLLYLMNYKIAMWWLQIFAICEVVIVPRLISDQRVRLFMTVCAVMLWMAMLVACIQKYNIPLSSGLGSLFFGYFWWQFSEEQYRKRANHWRRVLEIDTLI
ncbi:MULTISPECIES: phospholipid phosphatase [Leuconostoc]|nr:MULTISPECIES: phospholipid phosphatase [Leuconostoc]